MSKNTSVKQDPPFFVGYLPMPSQLKKFYWLLAIILIASCGWLGYWIAAQQKSTGPAIWNTAHTTTMRGLLTTHPYPILHRFNPQNTTEVESVLLVDSGKHSAIELLSGFEQQMVAIEGNEIRRGGWAMLELNSNYSIRKINPQTANASSQNDIQSLLSIKSLGAITLNGEIVDSKCFLGVMKPGAGKIHKACAEVCLLGGIPPMLVAKDARNQKFGYLLTDTNRTSAAQHTAKFAAEAVQISGQLQQQGDLLFIVLDDDGIRRL